jgi:hypothetical protein
MKLSKLRSTLCFLSLFTFIQPAIAINSDGVKPGFKDFALVPIALMISTTARLGENKARSPTVGTIDQKIEAGCGCAFSFSDKSRRSKGLIFRSIAGEPTAIMNIDGRDIQLQKIDKNRYSNDSISVILNLKQTKVEYESANYIGTIKVKHSGKTTNVKVIGDCGC